MSASNQRKVILIVTSKEDLTADYLIIRLKERGIPFFRLNTEDMPVKVEGVALFPECGFKIRTEQGAAVHSDDVVGIWYRRPKLLEQCPEIDLEILPYVREDSWVFANGLLDLADGSVNWVSRPDKIRRAENKLYQLKVSHELGLSIPKTFVGNAVDELRKLLDSFQNHSIQFVTKPIRSGRYSLPEGLSIFYTSEFPSDWNPSEIRSCPVIVQEKIAKKRDIRVTAVGKKLFCVGINTEGMSEDVRLDWRRATDSVGYKPIDLPDDLSKKLIEVLNIMGLSFGAFDLVETVEGDFVFLELNPNGQWAWIEEKTGLPIRDALIDTLTDGV